MPFCAGTTLCCHSMFSIHRLKTNLTDSYLINQKIKKHVTSLIRMAESKADCIISIKLVDCSYNGFDKRLKRKESVMKRAYSRVSFTWRWCLFSREGFYYAIWESHEVNTISSFHLLNWRVLIWIRTNDWCLRHQDDYKGDIKKPDPYLILVNNKPLNLFFLFWSTQNVDNWRMQ